MKTKKSSNKKQQEVDFEQEDEFELSPDQ